MSDLIREVSPLTSGIIWLVSNEKDSTNPHYADLDYLLDGLLTAYPKDMGESKSQLLIGKNFGKDFYLFIVKEIARPEIESFVSLIQKQMSAESDILILNDNGLLEVLRPHLSSIQSRLRVL